jgi:hypothetical protein
VKYGLDGLKMKGMCFQFCFSLLRYCPFLSQKLHFCLGSGNMKYFRNNKYLLKFLFITIMLLGFLPYILP